MKTTKKIFAAFLAVMMIALMIPFTASAAAADSYKVTLDSSYTVTNEKGQVETKYRDGFTVSIYKVASLNAETGEYTPVAGWSDKVKTALESKTSDNGINSANLLAELNKDYNGKTAVDTWTIGEGARTKELTVYKTPTGNQLGFGIYFIAWTGYPADATVASFNNTVVSLPYYGIVGDDGTAKDWIGIEKINLGSKVNTGEPTVKKEFVGRDDVFTDNNGQGKASVTEYTGATHTINFKLTGSVTGTNEVPSTSYKITDTYTNGLTVNTDSVAVTLTGGVKNITLTKDTDYTVTSGSDNFTVELKSNVLNKDADLDSDTADKQNFYSFTNVEVTYNGYLNDNAVNVLTTNIVDLYYSQKVGQVNKVTGNELHLYSFSLDVVKVDANNPATKLGNATFQLSSEDGTYVVSQTTSSEEATKGVATFSGLKAGTYKLQETAAPAGYNINSTVYTITIGSDGSISGGIVNEKQAVVPDTPLIVPETGGMGTMMFTIGGAALIACAGVLFLIVRKKKSAK
ncbi:MAG: SpaA isopeptide-forming pilin-related protein [Ruminococcus sp.]